MIKTREDFIEKVRELNHTITQLLMFLEEENKDGKQFDFVNTPDVPIETLSRKVKTLERKWFQEG